MFFYRSLKTALENTQNSSLYRNLKLTFLEIFKNVSFCFSQFSRNFVFKKIPFYGTVRFLTCFSVDPKKLKNTENSSFYSILKLTFLLIFKNEFLFSKFFQNFFSQLMPGFHRLSHKYFKLIIFFFNFCNIFLIVFQTFPIISSECLYIFSFSQDLKPASILLIRKIS